MRIVVKVGTHAIATRTGRPDYPALRRLVSQLCALRKGGNEVVFVSSGAVAAGVESLGLSARPTNVNEIQMCAAVGQARPLRAIIRAKLVRLAAITAIFASMVTLGLATTSNRVGSLTGNVHQISHLHDRTFWHSAWGAAFFGVAGLILGLLAAAQLSGGVTGPVSVFAKAAVDLTERPTDGEFPTGHRIVELNQFATALNRLLAAQRAA